MDDLAEYRHVLGLHGQRVKGGVDRALERVLDRHQRALDGAEVDRHHRVVDRGLGNQVEPVLAGGGADQRLLGEGPLRSEIGDAHPPDAVPLAGLLAPVGLERAADRLVLLGGELELGLALAHLLGVEAGLVAVVDRGQH